MNTSRLNMIASTAKALMPQPGCLQVGLALGDQFAQRWRAGRQAEAEEIQGGEGADGAGEDERHEGHGGDHGVGQDVRGT